VTFDAVDHATRYKIRLSQGESVIGEWFVTAGFDLSLIADYGTYDIQIKAIGGGVYADSPFSDKVAIELVDPDATDTLEAESLNDFTLIRWIGRTWYETLSGRRYFWNTASGFDVSFDGTELKATFYATNTGVTGKHPFLVILLDGEEDPTKGITIELTQGQAEYTLVSELEDGPHTVKVLKRSEAQDSDTAVLQVVTDGKFLAPTPVKTFKIQYIGASTSVGYGDLGPANDPKTTDNSNGLLCYTYLTSYLLDAETSIFASSGWGITRGWNTSGQVSATQSIPAAYEYYATNAQNYVVTTPGQWDHSDYQPDVIVLALGGNDFSSSNYASLSAAAQLEFRNAVTDAYVAFITALRAYHPDAYIILVYGLMSEALHVQNVSIDAATRAAAQFDRISSIKVAGAGSSGTLGSNYHPNVATYITAAGQLADHITAITGREQVNGDIVF
ncbi:MAG: SGNH/GDSL hydrolase family protein, partial [Bacillota bacterium]|nr:SGNH/GDSL hydrolase family protein [Bacillota bacterium]